MDWRREDTTYAAATIVAAALVVYVIAGNFGLVATPFSPSTPGPRAALALPGLPLNETGQTAANGTRAPGASRGPIGGGNAGNGPASDTVRPTATITTPSGLVAGITEGAEVSGTARDNHSGIKAVAVAFDPDVGDTTIVNAHVSCESAKRLRCTWSVDIPFAAGSYHVTARVTDRAGNRATAGPVDLTVVNIGGTIEDIVGDEPPAEGDGAPSHPLEGLLGGLLG